MKKIATLLVGMAFAGTAFAQTLNVNQGQVTYAVPASQMSQATVTSSTLTIGQKTYQVSDITSITVDNSAVTDNTVNVVYNGTTANVVIAGNIANIVSAQVSGAHVTLIQSEAATEEITYNVSGSSSNGSLYMDGQLKATFVLDGLTLTNPDSCAINIEDGKRIAIVLNNSSTLTDGITGADDDTDAHKACFYVNGHPEFEGTGSLTINGMVKHGLATDEYCEVKGGTITVASAVGDGFHIGQYYEQKGGTVTITAVGDGIDVGAKKDTSVENNGQMIIEGGTAVVSVSGASSDALKCEGAFSMTDGNLNLLATGLGGRVLSADGDVAISGGKFQGAACGDTNTADEERKAHGIKTDANITISGGEVYVAASEDDGKAFKTDNLLTFNGGTIMGIGGKKSTPADASTQKSNTYKDVVVKSGATVTYDGVSFTVPTQYSNTEAKVIVSKAGL